MGRAPIGRAGSAKALRGRRAAGCEQVEREMDAIIDAA